MKNKKQSFFIYVIYLRTNTWSENTYHWKTFTFYPISTPFFLKNNFIIIPFKETFMIFFSFYIWTLKKTTEKSMDFSKDISSIGLFNYCGLEETMLGLSIRILKMQNITHYWNSKMMKLLNTKKKWKWHLFWPGFVVDLKSDMFWIHIRNR